MGVNQLPVKEEKNRQLVDTDQRRQQNLRIAGRSANRQKRLRRNLQKEVGHPWRHDHDQRGKLPAKEVTQEVDRRAK